MNGPTSAWTGTWVSQRLGVTVQNDASASAEGLSLTDLAGLAVRRNPRRAHLVVSLVLGKHVPARPADCIAAGLRLGRLAVTRMETLTKSAAAARGGSSWSPEDRVLVLGSAETATALGHLVADSFHDGRYLHTTRRRITGLAPAGAFEETHSHATEHLLLPADPDWLACDDPVVIVDDEFTTGRTAMATIRALHAISPHRCYLIASLLDLRSESDRAELAELASDLDTFIDVTALVTDQLALSADILERGQKLVAALENTDPQPKGPPCTVRKVVPGWPSGLPVGGRHGFTRCHRVPFGRAIASAAEAVSKGISPTGTVLVLGTEELMYAPMMLADGLATRYHGSVLFSSTTRSPVLPVPDEGYAVRTRLSFDSHDRRTRSDGTRRFVYNVAPWRDEDRFRHIVVVVDAASNTPELWGATGLVEALRPVCDGVSVVELPEDTALAARDGQR